MPAICGSICFIHFLLFHRAFALMDTEFRYGNWAFNVASSFDNLFRLFSTRYYIPSLYRTHTNNLGKEGFQPINFPIFKLNNSHSSK